MECDDLQLDIENNADKSEELIMNEYKKFAEKNASSKGIIAK